MTHRIVPLTRDERPASPPHPDRRLDGGPHRALAPHPQVVRRRISHELAEGGTAVSMRIVPRWLERHGLNH